MASGNSDKSASLRFADFGSLP
ncbi:unnamed protein product, partial [Rotaria magnacalcarata]